MANLNRGVNMKSSKILALAAVAAVAACPPEPVPEPEKPVAATVTSFTSSAPIVEVGAAVTLSWQVQNAASVTMATASGQSVAIANPGAASGSVEVTLEEDTIFVLSAHGDGGSDSRALAVAVSRPPEELLFTAFPQRFTSGDPVALVWNAPALGPIAIRDGAGTEVLVSQQSFGTHVVYPSVDTTYTLTAGALSASVEVTVAPSILAFEAASPSIQPGESIRLSWRVGGAAEVDLSGEGRGVLHSETDPARIADGSFEETAPAGMPDRNGFLVYTLTALGGAETVSRTVSVYVGVDPAITAFKVPSYGRAGGTFEVQWATLEADEVEVAIDGVPVYVAQTAALVAAGQYSLATPVGDAQVTLTARNARGGAASQSLPISPVGVTTLQSFKVTPATVSSAGDPATVEWNVPNARRLLIWIPGEQILVERSGVDAEIGSLVVYPNDPIEIVLEADNTIGDKVGPVTLTPSATTRSRLTFSPASMPYGSSQNLTGSTVVTGALVARNFVVRNAPGEAFVDIAGTGTSVGFATSTSALLMKVDLGTPFETSLFGKRFSTQEIAVTTRGWMSLDPNVSNTSTTTNEWASIPLPEFAISPYLEIIQKDAEADVLWQMDGSGATQRVIVQWENVRYSTTNTKRLTFQVQLHASGKVVFAYKNITGLASGDIPSIGIVRPAKASVLAPASRQMVGARPVDGDTLTFFGALTLPLDVGAFPDRYEVDVQLTGGGSLVAGGTPGVILPGDFWISEVNPFPGATTPEGEWIEITNATNNAFDLSGWEINFGVAGTHQIPASANVELPAQGTLLLAASGDPAQNGGIAPDYVYGPGFAMSDTAGSVSIAAGGQPAYDTATWAAASGQAEGVSVRFDPVLLNHRFLSGTTQSTCAGTGTYGSQTGSPGVRVPGCFPYRLKEVAVGNFESIAITGTKINPATPTNEFLVALNFPANLPMAIKVGNNTYNRLYVGDNGFIALRDQAETALSCTSCYAANKTGPSTAIPTRVAAPFWDSLSATTPTSGIYLERKDPDTTVTGDEYTIVSWEHWNWSTSTTTLYDLNFQVKFFDDGDIEYHYGTMTGPTQTNADGNSATIWLESHDAKTALVRNINTTFGARIQSDMAVRFEFVP